MTSYDDTILNYEQLLANSDRPEWLSLVVKSNPLTRESSELDDDILQTLLRHDCQPLAREISRVNYMDIDTEIWTAKDGAVVIEYVMNGDLTGEHLISLMFADGTGFTVSDWSNPPANMPKRELVQGSGDLEKDLLNMFERLSDAQKDGATALLAVDERTLRLREAVFWRCLAAPVIVTYFSADNFWLATITGFVGFACLAGFIAMKSVVVAVVFSIIIGIGFTIRSVGAFRYRMKEPILIEDTTEDDEATRDGQRRDSAI